LYLLEAANRLRRKQLN